MDHQFLSVVFVANIGDSPIKHDSFYLVFILDLHTHKVVGYDFSRKMDKSLVIRGLDKALLKQGKTENVILHTAKG